MPGFLTDAQLQTQIEGVLHQNPAGSLVAQVPAWGPIITEANAAAWSKIQTALLTRGFSAAQVLGWDFGPQYQTEVGLYLALTAGAALHTGSVATERIDEAKRFIDDLPNVLVVSGGMIT